MKKLILLILMILSLSVNVYASDEQQITKQEISPVKEYIGEFTITYYCPCGRCNGYDKHGNPRSYDRYGNPLVWGTVAVDPRVISMHSRLEIEGYEGIEFVARDVGSGVNRNHIDMYVPVSHSEASDMGVRKHVKVWSIK